MLVRKLALIAAALAALVIGSAAVLAQGKVWTEVRLATEGAFRPWNFTNADGTLGGFEIDLYKDLCARMKVTCTIGAQDFNGMIPALNAGKFDAIIAGMSATAKREEAISFSVPYGTTGQTFATLESGGLTALPDKGKVFSLSSDEPGALAELAALKPLLKGKAVGVQTASIALAFLEKYLKDTVDIREYKTTEQHDLDLLSGRVDLNMASVAYLTGAIEKTGSNEMTLAGPRFIGGLLGRGSSIGLRKSDPELKAMFDRAIGEAQAEGVIARLSDKWFGYDVTPR